MHRNRLDLSKTPYVSESGYEVWELVGKSEGAVKQSVAWVRVPVGKTVEKHYHASSEETYFFLEGRARMIINGEVHEFRPKEICFLKPGDRHELEVLDDQPVEFIAVSAPAFDPTDYLKD